MIPNDVITNPGKRHDFVFLFDVTNGNPNGDPDANNAPRTDPDTGTGLVSDVSIKRKVRDMVALLKGEAEGFRIYVQTQGLALNALLSEAHGVLYGTGMTDEKTKERGEKAKGERRAAPEEVLSRRAYMYQHFYDIRLFGAVMSTGDYPAGQVHGPMQILFADSIDPVSPLELAITRVAVTRDDPTKPEKRGEMGRKMLLPYALYRGAGFFSPSWARLSGASEEDLAVFWTAFQQMWDNHRSASSGMQALYKLYIFSHDSPLGNAPTHRLFSRIQVMRNADVQFPRRREDYTVTVDEADMPAGVFLTKIEV